MFVSLVSWSAFDINQEAQSNQQKSSLQECCDDRFAAKCFFFWFGFLLKQKLM